MDCNSKNARNISHGSSEYRSGKKDVFIENTVV